MKIKFNVNEYVWVKLAPIGLAILKCHHDGLRATFPNLPEFTPPPTDENGYARFQLWSLMEDFGDYMAWGREAPFETTIFFEMKGN